MPINPDATHPVTVRCVCVGTPHESDTINVRSEYGYGDELWLSKQSVRYQSAVITDKKTGEDKAVVMPYTDAFAQEESMLELGVKSWTIVDGEGEALPIALSTILLLPGDVGALLSVTINDFMEKSRAPVPNGSGAPSPASSPESGRARPNRATRRSRKHSTPN